MQVKVKVLSHAATLPLPAHETPGSAAVDLKAAIPQDCPEVIKPGEDCLLPTGLCMEIPDGYVGLIFARSGLGMKKLVLTNGTGVIDSDYRGEVMVKLSNQNKKGPMTINRGDRVAQMIIVPCISIQWVKTANISETKRGSGGLGHTGV